MRTLPTSTTARTRRRLVAGAAAGTLLLAACGGGSDDASDALPEAAPAASDNPSDNPTDDAVADTDQAAEPVELAAGMVDLVGPEVQASADYEGNQLPNVVVDELGTGRKVNFRNLVPQDKPILLWMWAPH